MAVKATDIASIIVERIEFAHPGLAVFSADEIDDWPHGSLDYLRESGILHRAQRAKAVWCPGCSWQCHKPVVIRTERGGPGRHAFIICDEKPNLGRQAMPLRSLDQYAATLANISCFIAGRMKVGVSRSSPAGMSFSLGSIKGRHGLRQIFVTLEAGRLILRVGREVETMARVLRWVDANLSIDMAHIQRLANRKEPLHPPPMTRPPDRTQQQARSRETRTRNDAIFREAKKRRAGGERSWTAVADAIAVTNLSKAGQRRQVSAATVRRIVTEMRRCERQNFRSNSN